MNLAIDDAVGCLVVDEDAGRACALEEGIDVGVLLSELILRKVTSGFMGPLDMKSERGRMPTWTK